MLIFHENFQSPGSHSGLEGHVHALRTRPTDVLARSWEKCSLLWRQPRRYSGRMQKMNSMDTGFAIHDTHTHTQTHSV